MPKPFESHENRTNTPHGNIIWNEYQVLWWILNSSFLWMIALNYMRIYGSINAFSLHFTSKNRFSTVILYSHIEIRFGLVWFVLHVSRKHINSIEFCSCSLKSAHWRVFPNYLWNEIIISADLWMKRKKQALGFDSLITWILLIVS